MARREFAKIGTDMPDEPSIRALGVGEQWLYDRLLLRKDLSRCGVTPLRVLLWTELAADATDRKVTGWLRTLATTGHVIVDERYAEVLVRTYVRHDGLLGQPNVVAAMVTDFQLIASPAIRLAFMNELRRLWDLDLSDGERGGWLLAMGCYPKPKTDGGSWPHVLDSATLARLRKSIGTGLRTALTDALAEGSVPAFTEQSPGGIPEPFGGTLPGTPSCGRDRGELRRPSPSPTTTTGTSAVVVAGAQQPSTPAPAPTGVDDHDGHAYTLLNEHELAVGTRLSQGTRQQLLERIHDALDRARPDQVAEALRRYRDRASTGRDTRPGLLPRLLDDVLTGTAPTTGGRSAGGRRANFEDGLDVVARLEAAGGGTR